MNKRGAGTLLFLNGGTALGEITVAAEGNAGNSSARALPGGIIEGRGIVGGTALIGGTIPPGPVTGILDFQSAATIAGSSLILWRLEKLVDDDRSKAGEGWNALHFDDGGTTVGSAEAHPMTLLDFGALGSDPDGGDPFWSTPHQWSFIHLLNGGLVWYLYGNFDFLSGTSSSSWPDGSPVIYLQWSPLQTARSLAEARIARAASRGGGRRAGHGGARHDPRGEQPAPPLWVCP